jgi:hypothetical protein
LTFGCYHHDTLQAKDAARIQFLRKEEGILYYGQCGRKACRWENDIEMDHREGVKWIVGILTFKLHIWEFLDHLNNYYNRQKE